MKADETSTANTNVVHPRPSVFAQVKYLLLLEASYKAVCEKRDKIQYRWVQPPEREALQAIADGLAGEIMRTESNIIEGLKASVRYDAAGGKSSNAAETDSRRIAGAIRDWKASQGLRPSGDILDDALDEHERRVSSQNDQAHPTAAESDGGAGGKESNGR